MTTESKLPGSDTDRALLEVASRLRELRITAATHKDQEHRREVEASLDAAVEQLEVVHRSLDRRLNAAQLQVNQRMAVGTERAAKWAMWAAIFTAVGTLVDLVLGVIQRR